MKVGFSSQKLGFRIKGHVFEVQGLENRVFGRVVLGPGVWPLDFAV